MVSKSGQHYPMAAKLRFNCTNNMAKYEACVLGLKMAIDMNVYELLVIGDSDLLIHQVQGKWAVKKPENYTLRAVCAKSVQKVPQDRVLTYSQNIE